jgi:hypothetical protein
VQGESRLLAGASAGERTDHVVPRSWLLMIPSSGKREVSFSGNSRIAARGDVNPFKGFPVMGMAGNSWI